LKTSLDHERGQIKIGRMNEVARMHIQKMQLMLDERLRQELAKPGLWGKVSLDIVIQNGVITLFEVSAQETIRTKPV